jgi:hypothetical protein
MVWFIIWLIGLAIWIGLLLFIMKKRLRMGSALGLERLLVLVILGIEGEVRTSIVLI